MRIVQFVSYVSADGAFGGPVAVAVAQARELARRGHDVVLLAGWDGVAELRIPGVRVVLARVQRLPGLGFSGLRSRGALSWLAENAPGVDVLHVHAGRHLLDLEVALTARRLGVRYVMQTHGMVMPGGALPMLVDCTMTARAIAGAAAVLALTDEEERGLREQFPGAAVSRIRNGIEERADAPPVVGDDRGQEVLFVARLHPRKRVMAFAEMAALVSRPHPGARFVVVGPDEGDLPALREFMAEHPDVPLSYDGPLAPGEVTGRLAGAAVYVLPSLREVFPMTVLEALSVGTPVVLTEDCGISDELRVREAALVTDGSPDDLARAVGAILSDGDLRDRLDSGMRLALAEAFSIRATADALLRRYQAGADAGSRPSIVWLTNVAPPYRVPVWDALARDADLEVWLLETDARLRRDDNNRGDDWTAGGRQAEYTMRFLRSRVIRRGEARHYVTAWIRPTALRSTDAILIGGWDSPAFWVASWSAKIAGVRRVGFYESHRLSQRHTRGPIARIRRAFFAGMDEIVVPGVAARDALVAEGVDPRRIRLGFNAVDVEGIHARTRSVLARVGSPVGPVGRRLLCIGQLIHRKNVPSLIEALAAPELAGCTLTIVGTGPDRAPLEGLVARLGLGARIRFTGYVPTSGLPELFADHDVLVHPALQEVWGLTVNEALAAGLSVVVGEHAGVTPSVRGMPGVVTTGVTVPELRRAISAAVPATRIDEPEILAHTPEAFAATFRQALLPDDAPSA
ncbi:glycosyltransferase [Clavibacter capsici]|uniref:glycosyltransferase n=1 Tax=Clavibacter capsici TaxID=1874630 RepID=UPI0014285A82|nr:glycosyltransferase [Clavibacter capsici]QIS39199.1 glycosyltransferase [Clavibacter capsici]